MSHAHHHHGHAHGAPREGGERRLWISIVLNLTITAAEVVGGILSGSLALLSDALHNFSDTASLGVSLGARRIAQRDPNRRKTFGYRRAEVLGAFVNLVTLVLVALYLIYEAVERFLDPQPIDGGVMLAVATIGLAANLITALLLWRDAQESLNIRSAFVHIVGDTLSSVGVVLGGLLILRYQVFWVDPALTLGIACYILFHSYHMLRQTANILMEGTPPGLRLDALAEAVEGVERVRGMHHLHVWQLDETHAALEAHVVIARGDLERMEQIKAEIKRRLAERFGIAHSTLEFEFAPCAETGGHCYAHDAAAQPAAFEDVPAQEPSSSS